MPAPDAPSTTRRGPWFELVTTATAVAVLGVVAYAVYRHVTQPGQPVLPASWCRVGAVDSLPPLLGPALLTRWHADPIALAIVGFLAVLYVGGMASAYRLGTRWPARDAAWFLGGLVVCGLATNSSIAVYDMALFSAHMIGHLMLVMAGPVLLCAGRPLNLLLAATADPWRNRTARLLTGRVGRFVFCPPVAFAAYTAVIVGSHLTGIMDTVMQRPWAGQLEHLVYVIIGVQFFTLVVTGDPPIRWQLTTPARWIMLALAMAVDTITGVVLIMSTQPIAMQMVPGLNVNPLADTRTGGAIMWVGGDGLMASVMVVLAVTWLRNPAQREHDRGAWFEQARLSTFTAHTGVATAYGPAARIEFDDQDSRRIEYNAWLATLEDPSAAPTDSRR